MVRVLKSTSEELVIDLEKDMIVLSTAGCPKILDKVKYIVFKRVPKNFGYVDLEEYCRGVSSSLQLNHEEVVAFLTAVDVSTYSYAKTVYRGIEVETFITFGVDTPSCFSIDGEGAGNGKAFNTINIAVIVNKPLSKYGLLDLFRLVAEVKGAVLSLTGPQCVNGVFMGTASDAITVAAPGDGEIFAGIATDIGVATCRSVVEALAKHITKVSPEDYVAKTLGLKNFDELVELAIKVYSFAPIPTTSSSKVRTLIVDELRKSLGDPNVQLLIRGAKLGEVVAQLGLLPSITSKEFSSDTPRIVVDELIGKAVSEYLNGFKGLLAYYWVERLKEEGVLQEIGRLPPITDDLVGSIIGGVLSRIYDRFSGG